MKWFVETLVRLYHCWEPIEKLIITAKQWVQQWIPPWMMEIVHIDYSGKSQLFYKQAYFFPPKKWTLNQPPHLFIFHLWNSKTLRTEHYCLSKNQVKKAFGFNNDITLCYLSQFDRHYLVSTIIEYTTQLEKAPILSVMPYQKYCRALESYKSTVFGIQNLTVYQLCCLASFLSHSHPLKKNEPCQATIVDEKLIETVKYNDEFLFTNS